MSPFFCARSDQCIICCFGGFILSIFCFLPQHSPPSGSERVGGKSQPSTRLQVALKYFTAKRKKRKNPTLENKRERGSPEGIGSGWKAAKFGKHEDTARAGGQRREHKDALACAAISRGWRRRRRLRLRLRRGRDPGQPPSSAQRHRALLSALPCSPPSRPPPASLSLAFSAAEGFRCPTAV